MSHVGNMGCAGDLDRLGASDDSSAVPHAYAVVVSLQKERFALVCVAGDMARGRSMVVPLWLARLEVMVAAWVMSHLQIGEDDSAVVHAIRTVVARGMVRACEVVVASVMSLTRAVDVHSFMERAK